MASQNEMHEKPGNESTSTVSKETGPRNRRSTDLESGEQQYQPFSAEDPFRSSRITSLRSEAKAILAPIQGQATGFKDLNDKQLRNIHNDAVERSGWQQARQDGFIGLLRLGNRTPPRSKRVL